MNIAAIDARTSPRQGACVTAVWAKRVVGVLFAASVAALEACPRAPVQPVLDACLVAVRSRALSISAAIFRPLSF
ncbi:hypothetical protein [Paraburkholderia sp. Cpub6]|uniref:hypothetical protein n=1 Tax=Paraburkholderia sp. Cpub6 TaxID=2723094 RepID=UPI00160F3AC2|nr:hypothetical protein [Paraburkholderia sp. Cpub6]MBB5463857.1 hypothetical protein [Paraburkholderia sp. Cpub6]